MTKDEALRMALELLAVATYHSPDLQAKRTKVIDAGLKALAQPQQELNLAEAFRTELDKLSQRNYELRMENAQLKAQPQQEPVAWLTEERYAEMHTSKWTPKIQQVFSKDGILESQTIQYAPQSKPVSYPPPQRTWQGLTDEEAVECWPGLAMYADCALFWKNIENKLMDKNS